MSEQSEQGRGGTGGKLLRFFVFSVGVIMAVLIVAFLAIRSDSRRAGGSEQGSVPFVFEKNEDVFSLAGRLEKSGLIRSEYAFLYFLWSEDSWKDLQAGNYLLSGKMTIPEIVGKILRGETIEKGVKVTFPEGWTAKEMAARLDENGFSGERFLELVNHPKPEWQSEFPFLTVLPRERSLEGFLFPDTYYFDPKLGEEKVIEKILENFGKKTSGLFDWEHEAVRESVISTYGELVLSSIVEAEVKTESDRHMVADIFLRRIAAGMPLQSDATVRYALGVTKIQHSAEDIAIDSPYNTYRYKGLPPGPIGNPGIVSLRAVTAPQTNPYLYFLNNPETGATVFSVTFEEHVANKAKNGL